MSKLDSLVISAKSKALSTVDSFVDTLKEKKHGDSQLVVALVLIAVALGLCLLFRTQIKTIMTSLFTSIGTAITNLSAESGS